MIFRCSAVQYCMRGCVPTVTSTTYATLPPAPAYPYSLISLLGNTDIETHGYPNNTAQSSMRHDRVSEVSRTDDPIRTLCSMPVFLFE